MGRTAFTDIRELFIKPFSSRSFGKTFGELPVKLSELVCVHFELIGSVQNIGRHAYTQLAKEDIENIKRKLEENKQLLIGCISRLTNRKILVHKTGPDDTLRKISKRYGSEIYEISELNNIKSIYLTGEKNFLLVPVKFTGI